MYYVILALILVACLLIVIAVLIQNSKGGGLASNFQSQNQYMGVRKTADFLEKATWTLAIVICVLSLLSVFVIPKNSNIDEYSGADTELRGALNNEGTQDAVDFQAPPAEEPAAEE
ncbi:MAG: preprotein translocase subunit SecG [Bacteroidales bacterium]|nr:preprotein translocase subunit SecG [Bacteroidales bacterium]